MKADGMDSINKESDVDKLSDLQAIIDAQFQSHINESNIDDHQDNLSKSHGGCRKTADAPTAVFQFCQNSGVSKSNTIPVCDGRADFDDPSPMTHDYETPGRDLMQNSDQQSDTLYCNVDAAEGDKLYYKYTGTTKDNGPAGDEGEYVVLKNKDKIKKSACTDRTLICKEPGKVDVVMNDASCHHNLVSFKKSTTPPLEDDYLCPVICHKNNSSKSESFSKRAISGNDHYTHLIAAPSIENPTERQSYKICNQTAGDQLTNVPKIPNTVFNSINAIDNPIYYSLSFSHSEKIVCSLESLAEAKSRSSNASSSSAQNFYILDDGNECELESGNIHDVDAGTNTNTESHLCDSLGQGIDGLEDLQAIIDDQITRQSNSDGSFLMSADMESSLFLTSSSSLEQGSEFVLRDSSILHCKSLVIEDAGSPVVNKVTNEIENVPVDIESKVLYENTNEIVEPIDGTKNTDLKEKDLSHVKINEQTHRDLTIDNSIEIDIRDNNGTCEEYAHVRTQNSESTACKNLLLGELPEKCIRVNRRLDDKKSDSGGPTKEDENKNRPDPDGQDSMKLPNNVSVQSEPSFQNNREVSCDKLKSVNANQSSEEQSNSQLFRNNIFKGTNLEESSVKLQMKSVEHVKKKLYSKEMETNIETKDESVKEEVVIESKIHLQQGLDNTKINGNDSTRHSSVTNDDKYTNPSRISVLNPSVNDIAQDESPTPSRSPSPGSAPREGIKLRAQSPAFRKPRNRRQMVIVERSSDSESSRHSEESDDDDDDDVGIYAESFVKNDWFYILEDEGEKWQKRLSEISDIENRCVTSSCMDTKKDSNGISKRKTMTPEDLMEVQVTNFTCDKEEEQAQTLERNSDDNESPGNISRTSSEHTNEGDLKGNPRKRIKKKTNENDMIHKRTDSMSTTASENDYRKKFHAKTKRIVQRRSKAVMYQRLSDRYYENERMVLLEKSSNNDTFGFQIKDSAPVVISAILEGSIAESVGLKEGDVLISVNEINVLEAGHHEVVKLIGEAEDMVSLTVAYDNTSSDDKPICEGYLSKQCGNGLLRKWRRRWFILKPDRCLYYFKSEKDKDPLGAILLTNYTIVKAPELNRKYTFKATKYGQQTCYFQTNTEDDMNRWANAMSSVATASKEDTWLDISSHNVGLPALCIKEPDCHGHLTKLGNKHKTWKRRYCVLKDACLYYYQDVNSSTALGVAHMHGYRVEETNPCNKKFGFTLVPPEDSLRTFYFYAENETDVKRWVAAMELSIGRWIKADV